MFSENFWTWQTFSEVVMFSDNHDFTDNNELWNTHWTFTVSYDQILKVTGLHVNVMIIIELVKITCCTQSCALDLLHLPVSHTNRFCVILVSFSVKLFLSSMCVMVWRDMLTWVDNWHDYNARVFTQCNQVRNFLLLIFNVSILFQLVNHASVLNK